MSPEHSPGDEDPPKVLVVDDHPDNLKAIRAVMASEHFQLVEASSGEEALKKILHDDFAVVLLDVMMPGMDGFETARLIRAREASRPLPIIFLTATSFEAHLVSKGYQVGAVDYLVKPFDPGILTAKVSVFVELFRKERRIHQQERELRRWEQLRSEEALRTEEALYEATFEHAPIGIAHLSPRGQVLRANRHFAHLLRCTDGEALSLRLQDVAHADDLQRLWDGIHAVVAGEARTSAWEGRVLQKSGRFFWASATLSAVRAPNGAAEHLILVLADESERRTAEQRERFLAEASARLLGTLAPKSVLLEVVKLAVEDLADACGIELRPTENSAETEMVLASANPNDQDVLLRLSAWLGSPSDEQWGRSFLESGGCCIRGEPGDGGVSGLAELGLTSAMVIPLAVQDQFLGLLLFADLGHRRGPFVEKDLAVGRDLAHRIVLAIENARLMREAQAAVKSRDEFLSIASHELRTPLTPLQIVFQRYLSPSAKEPLESLSAGQRRTVLDRSERQVSRLITLVDNLLDVSRIAAGMLELEREPLDLEEIARDVTARFGEELARAECEIHFGATEGTHGSWDRMRIEQVVSNLLGNAIRYGGGRPIDISVGGGAGAVLLEVRDHGTGIRPEDLPLIFERYQRAGEARPPGGLGLGLYITRQIVEAHGGTIAVASNPGEGACFTVSLPTDRAVEEESFTQARLEVVHDTGVELKGRADRGR